MSDLVYDKILRVLSWPARGLRWQAVSGVGGSLALPSGRYRIGRREITQYTSAIDPAFRGPDGRGFFVPIYPLFETTRGKTGGRLGIHPDGNRPGTLGCIGLQERVSDFYQAIAQTPVTQELILEVVP